MHPTSVARLPVTSAGSPPAVRIDVQVWPPSVLFQKSPLLKCAALLSPAHATEPVPGEGGRVPMVAPGSVGQAYTPLTSHCEAPVTAPRYWISQTLSRVSPTVGSFGRSTNWKGVAPPSSERYRPSSVPTRMCEVLFGSMRICRMLRGALGS